MAGSPSEVGARAESAIAAALCRTGRTVFIPLFAPHARVDLVFEDHRGLHRVQCKTSVIRGDIVGFRTCSNTNNHPQTYRGQVEYFGVYSPELDAVYLVPASVVKDRYCYLRLRPARNNQRKRVHWAADYKL